MEEQLPTPEQVQHIMEKQTKEREFALGQLVYPRLIIQYQHKIKQLEEALEKQQEHFLHHLKNREWHLNNSGDYHSGALLICPNCGSYSSAFDCLTHPESGNTVCPHCGYCNELGVFQLSFKYVDGGDLPEIVGQKQA